MVRKAKESSVHEHAAGGEYMTKPSGEKHTKSKGHLMEGIVAGLPCRNMPPTIDGIVRGIPKYCNNSLSADVMKTPASATRDALGSFGAGLFPQGKM
jgi:hypothetical protein